MLDFLAFIYHIFITFLSFLGLIGFLVGAGGLFICLGLFFYRRTYHVSAYQDQILRKRMSLFLRIFLISILYQTLVIVMIHVLGPPPNF